jgi:hypothetical protein
VPIDLELDVENGAIRLGPRRDRRDDSAGVGAGGEARAVATGSANAASLPAADMISGGVGTGQGLPSNSRAGQPIVRYNW